MIVIIVESLNLCCICFLEMLSITPTWLFFMSLKMPTRVITTTIPYLIKFDFEWLRFRLLKRENIDKRQNGYNFTVTCIEILAVLRTICFAYVSANLFKQATARHCVSYAS